MLTHRSHICGGFAALAIGFSVWPPKLQVNPGRSFMGMRAASLLQLRLSVALTLSKWVGTRPSKMHWAKCDFAKALLHFAWKVFFQTFCSASSKWGRRGMPWRAYGNKRARECHGHDKYKKQVPLACAIPLRGGLAAGGFSTILYHPRRKTNAVDWSEMVEQGGLTKALEALNPKRKRGSSHGTRIRHCT